MNTQPRVLIVDRSLESRQVLRTALQRGDTQVLEAAHAKVGLELIRNQAPDVVVLDDETRECSPEIDAVDFGRALQPARTPVVVLGTARRSMEGFSSAEFIAKPYHYGPLVRRIEELLAQSGSIAAD